MNVQQMPQANGSVITLRPHQAEAVDAIVRGLSLPAGGTMPVRGLRGQVHMATGTGKTITAARAALRLCPTGVIGVLVPTLDLLTQTIEAWRRVGHYGPAVAVCSLGADPLLEALDVRCTTNPTQLALWASSGPMLVFATYASLASQGLTDDQDDTPDATAPGVLEQALRGTYGQTMAPFDLVVVDEAHRTSGNAAKAWASVHDQQRIPAARRLYMTATPRLWEAAPRTADEEADGDGDEPGSDGAANTPQSGREALGGRLLTVDWTPPRPGRSEGLVFIYDGGHLTTEQLAAVQIQSEELRGYAFIPFDDIATRLIPLLARRVHHSADARASRTTLYLENGTPA
ncbi:DEAD/DEAH box helicase family protein [Streptomyces fimicarius]|uniref:DEAD/DEAH box helicase family protein n=1 Tax=Streptomyces griseus TaxID=1911 RepID=UPI00368CC533